MPFYVIERAFAEDVDVSGDDIRQVDEINADEGVRWIFSFLSADRRQTYCLYEAPSPDAIIYAARRSNRPAAAVIELGPAPRPYAEVLEAWRTSCTRLTVWEDANDRGYIARRRLAGHGTLISLSA